MHAALSSEQRTRVLLVEFICHGVPSLRVFHRYLEELFNGDAVVTFTFRDKAFGWQTTLATSVEGESHHVPCSNDAFFQGFAVHHMYMMEACYQCPFARLPRCADITLGDFWGCPELWNDKRGVSIVLINSPAGLQAVELLEASDSIILKHTDVATATLKNQRAISGSYQIPKNRRSFLGGLARGEQFAKLKDRYFPSKLHCLRSAFLQSNSKWRFVVSVIDSYCIRAKQ
jgi:hypothetical protein